VYEEKYDKNSFYFPSRFVLRIVSPLSVVFRLLQINKRI